MLREQWEPVFAFGCFACALGARGSHGAAASLLSVPALMAENGSFHLGNSALLSGAAVPPAGQHTGPHRSPHPVHTQKCRAASPRAARGSRQAGLKSLLPALRAARGTAGAAARVERGDSAALAGATCGRNLRVHRVDFAALGGFPGPPPSCVTRSESRMGEPGGTANGGVVCGHREKY